MKEWQKLVTQIRSELLPLADEQLQLAQQAHAQGQGDLAAIFLARSQKRQLHLNLIDATSSYHLARIRHQAALGQP
jgi:outer membrane protein TolC